MPLVPPRRGEKLYMVPHGIRPVVHLTAIEVHNQAIVLLFYFKHHCMIRQTSPTLRFLLWLHFLI